MNKHSIAVIVIILTILVLAAGALSYFLFARRTEAPKGTVYFGFDSRLNPTEEMRIYSSLMRYLSQKTGYDFQVRFTKGYETTQDNLDQGTIQFAAMGAVSYLKAREKSGAKILVRGLNKDNQAEYQSIIFTRPDSPVKVLKDLRGRSLAFGAKNSTQGHLIPRQMLDEEGISLNGLKNYEYTGSHINAVNAVIEGRFDAGAAQDTLVREMAGQGKIKILRESRSYPSSGIVADKSAPPELVEAVRKALLELDPGGRHKSVLSDWDKTEMVNGFASAKDADYDELKKLMTKYGF